MHRSSEIGGQTLMQFALIDMILTVLITFIVEHAIVGGAGLRLFQSSHEGARYAAVDPGFTRGNIATGAMSAASPVISKDGGMDMLDVLFSSLEANVVSHFTLRRMLPSRFEGFFRGLNFQAIPSFSGMPEGSVRQK